MSFDKAIAFTLHQEGGYHAPSESDPNPTNFGITQKELDAAREKYPDLSLPLDVKNLTPDQATAIYRRDYWDVHGIPSLPEPLDLVTFDFGVNSGPAEAVAILQGLLDVAQDGGVGPLTLAAIQATPDAHGLVEDYIWARVLFDRHVALVPAELPNLPGWVKRCADLHEAVK